MKPLYIMDETGARISAQKRALRIESRKRAPAFIAIRHVSQVICPPDTCWTPRAMKLCMQNGVPVVFVTDRGRTLGFLHGTGRARRNGLFDRLCELLAQPEGARIYRTWWKAMESRQRCRLARRLRIPPDRHRCRTLRRAMQRARRQRASRVVVAMLEHTWKKALSGLVAEVLVAHGLDANRRRALWPRIDVAEDLSQLLEWRLFLPGLSELNRVQAELDRGRAPNLIRAGTLARFQCLAPELKSTALDVLHRLDARLLEEGIV